VASAEADDWALNHKVRGVAGVYRRHNFIEEKTEALERLSALLHEIASS
jgi:hypothetical protein